MAMDTMTRDGQTNEKEEMMLNQAETEQEIKEKEALSMHEEYDPLNYSCLPVQEKVDMTEYILSFFKYDSYLTLEQKVNVTSMIVYYRSYIDTKEFFEEECHLALVKWIYDQLDLFRSGKTDERVYILLYNILIIFTVLPINVEDLFELKIFEKLNKIRKLFKNKNLNIFEHLDNLLNYWTEFCSRNYVKKTCREKILEDDDIIYMEKSNKKARISSDDHDSIFEHGTQSDKLNEKPDVIKYNKGILKKIKIKQNKKLVWKENELIQIQRYNKDDPPISLAVQRTSVN